MGEKYISYYQSPLGYLQIEASEKGLSGLYFLEDRGKEVPNQWTQKAIIQLEHYFLGELKAFDLPLDLTGTPFQLRVWKALQLIKYGETVSYQWVARQIGQPNAGRAVGGANNKNPLSIIIPCHRVVGKNGALVGYGSGLDNKAWLIDFEKKNLKK